MRSQTKQKNKLVVFYICPFCTGNSLILKFRGFFSKPRFISKLCSSTDEVRWIQLITPCSPGQVITPDQPRPHRDTLSPRPILTPNPRLVHHTLATHLVSHTHGQVTLGALTLATIHTQGN